LMEAFIPDFILTFLYKYNFLFLNIEIL